MNNKDIAKHLQQIALLYSIQNDKWRMSAYERAAENVDVFSDPITKDNVTSVPYVGKGVANTILQFQREGISDRYRKLSEVVDPQCLTMTAVKGIGPKKAWKFYNEGIRNLKELLVAWKKGKIDSAYDDALKQIERYGGEKRLPHSIVSQMGNAILSIMSKQPGIKRYSLCGSVRRHKETSKDLDVLVSASPKHHKQLIDAFAKLGDVINKGTAKASIWYAMNGHTIQADLLIVSDASFGAALQYFTGSREHNIEVRRLAQKLGFKVNERGIYQESVKVGGRNEEDIYNLVGIVMPKPEER